METLRELLFLLLLCFLTPARGQGDFDLADALDDPLPTKKPGSDLYPKLPHYPQPGNTDDGRNIYPRPKPQPKPQPGLSDNSGGHFNNVDDGRYPPRPRPPAAGGGGGGGGYNGYGDTYGGGGRRPQPPYWNTYGGGGSSTYGAQGNTVARIVSPIVSVVVVALLGAGVSYFRSNRRGNCLRTTETATV